MIILFDLSDVPGQAAASLSARGVGPVEVVQRDCLRPKKLVATLRRLRRSRPQVCYIFCRHIRTQFNRFPLKLTAALSGVRTIQFCDEQEVGPAISPWRVMFWGLPVYAWRCLYGLLVVLAFAAAYFLLRVIVWLRKPIVPRHVPARQLCYIKTDFWHDLKAGGSVTHTREFINAGCDLGYNIKVFSCDPLVHYRLKPKVEVVEPSPALYDLPIIFSQMEYNLRFPMAVWRSLRGSPLDGIYQRHSSNNFSGVALSVLLKAPFFLEHNSSSAWIAKNWSAQRTSIIPGMCEKLNFSGAYKIAVVSEALRQSLLSAGLDGRKLIVNPNGVDPVRFGPHVDASAVRSTLPPGKLLIGFIGVFGQWHGVLTLMRAVKHVVKACANSHFVIIGDGTLKQQMLEILRQDVMVEHVTFVGLVKHDLAPAYLNACDVLVSPHEDMADGSVFFGSPTKIFEYMATGKGIVASKVGQLGELLKGEQDALLVEQKNEKELARAIARLLWEPGLRTRLGASARQKVTVAYTWQENFRRAISPNPSSNVFEASIRLCQSAKA